MARCLAVLLLLVSLAAAAGCTNDRSADSDTQKPVFYGGVTGGPFMR